MTVESLLNFNKTMTDTLGKYLFKLNNNDIRTTPTDFGGSTLLMVEQHWWHRFIFIVNFEQISQFPVNNTLRINFSVGYNNNLSITKINLSH